MHWVISFRSKGGHSNFFCRSHQANQTQHVPMQWSIQMGDDQAPFTTVQLAPASALQPPLHAVGISENVLPENNQFRLSAPI